MLKSISVVDAVAASLVFRHHGLRGRGPEKREDDTPKPLPPLQKNFPLDQTWSLRELNGKPVPSGLDISLKIDGTLRGSGFTGCNSWSATMYPIKDQHLAVGPYALDQEAVRQGRYGSSKSGFLSALLGNPRGTSSTANSSSRDRAARCGSPGRSKPLVPSRRRLRSADRRRARLRGARRAMRRLWNCVSVD